MKQVVFEAQHRWLSMPGELTSRPCLRTIKLPYSLLDHAAPWWVGAMNDPEKRFPETFKIFQSIKDRALASNDKAKKERLLGILEMKREQLEAGIRAGYDEMAKM